MIRLFNRKNYYFDSAATTRISKESVDIMKAVLKLQRKNVLGCPSATHSAGQSANTFILDAGKKVSKFLGIKSEDIFFTSGASESNMIIIKIAVNTFHNNGIPFNKMHIILTSYEHHSMTDAVAFVKHLGVKVSFLNPNANFITSEESLKKALTTETILVSCMYVYNEIGTIQPISRLSKIVKGFNKNIIFHTDASQGMAYLPTNMESLGVDALSFGGMKIFGPQGVGVLAIKNHSLYFGQTGRQNKWDIRPGTMSVVLVSGLGGAIDYVTKNKPYICKRLRSLQKYTIQKIYKELPDAKIININKNKALDKEINVLAPHIIYLSFNNINTEYLVTLLDTDGFSLTTRTACAKHYQKEGNHIKLTGIRISLSIDITKRDIDNLVKSIKQNLKLSIIANK